MNVLIMIAVLIAAAASVACCVCAVWCIEKLRTMQNSKVETPAQKEPQLHIEHEQDNKATNDERKFYEGLQSILNYSSDTMKSYLKGEDED